MSWCIQCWDCDPQSPGNLPCWKIRPPGLLDSGIASQWWIKLKATLLKTCLAIHVGINKCEQDHTITWIGRGLRKSVVQSSAQSRITCELRPGCSRICPVGSWQGPRLSLHNIFKQPVPGPDCPRGKKEVLYIQSEPLLFQFMFLVIHFPVMHCFEESSSIFLIPSPQELVGWCELPPKPSLLHTERAPFLQLLLTGQVLQPLTVLVPSAELTLVY